jgi:mannose-1-phosphate guanylyltransferase
MFDNGRSVPRPTAEAIAQYISRGTQMTESPQTLTPEKWEELSDQFIDAIETADKTKAAALLHEMQCLKGPALDALIDVLSSDDTVKHHYAQKLTFVNWDGPGAPSIPVRKRAKDVTLSLKIEHAKKKYGNIEAAIAAVKKETGLNRATLFAAKARAKKIGSKNMFNPKKGGIS